MRRRTYYFSGNVQGVGFRFTAQHIAKKHPVSGFVRNLADGRVELVMEGSEQAMDAVLRELQEQMEGNISKVQTDTSEGTGEYGGFGIKH